MDSKNGNLLANANSLQLQISDLNPSQHNGIYSVQVEAAALGLFIPVVQGRTIAGATHPVLEIGDANFIIDEGNDFIDLAFPHRMP